MLLSHLDGGRFYLDSNGKTKHGLHPLSCFPPSGEPDLAVVAVHVDEWPRWRAQGGGWFGGKVILLDAKPNVATTRPEDGVNHHCHGGARLGKIGGNGGGAIIPGLKNK
uniref:Uncharacterized protein n=1 Tax=Fagus sylvatica TaxID=28930 RepID=A0A2N9F7V3_FAGSY